MNARDYSTPDARRQASTELPRPAVRAMPED